MNLNELHVLLQNSIITSEPLIHPHLQTPPKGTVEDRVSIYANGFYARLEEVLLSDYGSLASILGEDECSTLFQHYLSVYPSCSYTLNDLGLNLEKFLKETPPYDKKPYLAEIAAFERAEYQAIVASDVDLLTPSHLQSIPIEHWPELTFTLHPSCKILTMHWNSITLIENVRANNPIPNPKKYQRPLYYVLVWRNGLEVQYCKLKSLEISILNAIHQQATFIEICELLSQKMPEDTVANYVVSQLQAWLQVHLFIN